MRKVAALALTVMGLGTLVTTAWAIPGTGFQSPNLIVFSQLAIQGGPRVSTMWQGPGFGFVGFPGTTGSSNESGFSGVLTNTQINGIPDEFLPPGGTVLTATLFFPAPTSSVNGPETKAGLKSPNLSGDIFDAFVESFLITQFSNSPILTATGPIDLNFDSLSCAGSMKVDRKTFTNYVGKCGYKGKGTVASGPHSGKKFRSKVKVSGRGTRFSGL